MDSSVKNNNERIVKNTLFLYMRMLLTMGISLYTSRVVLNALGVEDFGIYNVVGGFVAIFGFINGSMTAATQRYLSYAIGEDNQELIRQTFSTSVHIHILIAGIVLLLSETFGLWFMHHKMQIPEDRLVEAFWVFQSSVISSVVMIISVPYTAAIISYERMGAFAYISIFEVMIKLLIAFVIVYASAGRLVWYAVMLMLTQLVIQLCYQFYSYKNFRNCRVAFLLDKNLFVEMLKFSGWTMNGNLAVICYTQGLNVLLNIFFGPVVNAARGIAVQVQSAVSRFCQSFQIAVNPQITKSYAVQDFETMQKMVIISSKFSFFMVLMLALPIMLETQYVLGLWLGIVPSNTAVFTDLILCTTLLYTLSNPMIASIHATGQLKKFQIVEGSILLAILPMSYILLKFTTLPAFVVFVVHIAMEICAQLARVWIVLPKIYMPYTNYITKVLSPIVKVLLCAIPVPYLMCMMAEINSINLFLLLMLTTLVSVCMSAYCVGCSEGEKLFVKSFWSKIIYKIKNV